jgi:2-succinyl-5-enolpyruvyl-6-hydroxy-3-cyclohexene-1-carboxylate synthase
VICVIGDLSFFYDQNALWNQNLRGNLRILLLNNGRGGIFEMLTGLEQSPARSSLVAAAHHTSAEGVCRQNHVTYLKAENMQELQQGIHTLLNIESDRPVLLEVFTDAQADAQALRDYYHEQHF